MNVKRFSFPETVPLGQLENGAIRVRNSRVTLETIVIRMQVGDTVEEIHEGFPTVSITQIEEILAWYFDNKAEADEYLQQVQADADEIFRRIESQPEYKGRCEELRRRIAQLTET